MKILLSIVLLIFLFSSCRQASVHQLEYPWKPYSQAAIKDALAHKKAVIIDFWAEWCPNCHDLDREVFSLPDIQAKLAQVTALRMDVTNQDDPAVQKMIEQYDVEGIPTVIFLDTKGREIKDSRVIGFIPPKEFNEALAMLKIFK